MCTVMLDTQADAPPCCLWHASEHLWINGAKGVFRSSAQIFVAGVAKRNHSALDTTPQGVVRGGKVGTM